MGGAGLNPRSQLCLGQVGVPTVSPTPCHLHRRGLKHLITSLAQKKFPFLGQEPIITKGGQSAGGFHLHTQLSHVHGVESKGHSPLRCVLGSHCVTVGFGGHSSQ